MQEEFNIEDEKFTIIPHFIEKSHKVAEKKDQFVYLGRFNEQNKFLILLKVLKVQ